MAANLENMTRDQLIKYAMKVQDDLEDYKQKEIRPKVSNLNEGKTLDSFTDTRLAEMIKAKIPKCTYESVDVSQVEHTFYGENAKIRTRKIELKRESYKLLNDAPCAFFSSLCKGNSLYTRTLSKTGMKNYLLDARDEALKDPKVKENILLDIKAAYMQYKTITIYVPNDCEHDAEVQIESESKTIYYSINSAKFVRNLFCKK